MQAEKVRESVIAGTWYPGSPDKLKNQIQGYLAKAGADPPGGDLLGLIVPHAGYLYSGGVAAHAYRLLQDQPFDRVLILAPSHRAHFPGASVYHLGGYRTPLGVVSLDRALIDQLLEQDAELGFYPQAHAQEHSLEIQLPFLQVVLGPFRLTPIVMGNQSYESCRQLAATIAQVCRDQKVLLVASSDLSHYHGYLEAKQLDQRVLKCVEAFAPERLSRELARGGCEACGAGPMMTLLLASEMLGANEAKVLRYANSGDVTGDRSGVVGYMAAAVSRNPGTGDANNAKSKVGVDLGLSEKEKRTLKTLALKTIRCRIDRAARPKPQDARGKLKEPRGAFVTLRKKGALRGCIGSLVGRGPLDETVQDMAIQAAFSDPRFSPLSGDEFADIDLEISVLTPMKRIQDMKEIEIGIHGLYIRQGVNSGLLLPQVAVEHHWNRDEFLRWTCHKAGLPETAWKDPETEIYVFSADIF